MLDEFMYAAIFFYYDDGIFRITSRCLIRSFHPYDSWRRRRCRDSWRRWWRRYSRRWRWGHFTYNLLNLRFVFGKVTFRYHVAVFLQRNNFSILQIDIPGFTVFIEVELNRPFRKGVCYLCSYGFKCGVIGKNRFLLPKHTKGKS